MSSAEKRLVVGEDNSEEVDVFESRKDSKTSWFICFNGWLTQVVILGVLHGFGVFFIQFIQEFNCSSSKAGITSFSENSSETSDQKEGKDIPVSWFVCVCGFISRVVIVGVFHGFGPFFIAFVHEFGITKEKSAWVSSLAYGLSMTFGPVASMLTNRLGNRIVMVAGGIMCSVSILVASFVNSIEMLFLSFSLFYGIGACLCITPIMTIATQYFDKYLTIAVGIMTAGSSFGTLIYAPMSQALIDSIGWRNTFRIYSGLCSISAFCSIFIKPLVDNKKKDPIDKIKQSAIKGLIQDLKLWKNRVFVVWTVAITLVMFGFYIPYVHLVAYAEDCGIPPEKGAIFVMMLGACTAFGRIVFGKIIQIGFLNRLHMHQFSMVITGIAVIFLPLLKSFAGIFAYVICVGLVDGCYVVLLPVLTSSLVGLENTVLAWGFLAGTSSITFTAGPPLAGALYDMTGSYDLAFHLAGLPIIAGALVLFLIPWAQRTSQSDNVMIVVSEYNVADDYDFADDILDETRTLREINSRLTLNSDSDLLQRRQNRDFSPRMRGHTRFRSNRLKDQSTSTSPGSIQVPSDIQEALSMFHENAKMIANILQTSVINSNSEESRQGVKSRSEMMQNETPGFLDQAPQNVISIMSVPGGVAVGTFGANLGFPDNTSSNISIYPTSNQRNVGQTSSAASSLRSRAFDDPYRVASDVYSPPQSKVYHVHRMLSPESVDSSKVDTSVKEDLKLATPPLGQTLSENDEREDKGRVSGLSKSHEQKTTIHEPHLDNTHSKSNPTSPYHVSSPPTLQTIPEMSATSGKTDDPNSTERTPKKQQSTETALSVNSVSSTSENSNPADSKQTGSELDVFTHLFADDV